MGTYVRTMDKMPPPAPARAWATLSFWGITGLDAAGAMMVGKAILIVYCLVSIIMSIAD